jgi:hypothetical protein
MTMIRLSDLPHAAAWAQPSISSPRADVPDAQAWFHGDAAVAPARVSGDLSPASRGLSVQQHAAQVLAHLCGEAGERA